MNIENVYEDENISIEVPSLMKRYYETTEKLSKLDIHQKIRIMEFVVGIRDVKEIKDPEEVALVSRVLLEYSQNHISPELKPDNMFSNPSDDLIPRK